MKLIVYISVHFTTWLLSAHRVAVPQSPVIHPGVGANRFCKPGECCEFKLRIYQRCIVEDNYDTRSLETWPLFYDFVDKKRKPITPITRDYNKKACFSKDCGMDSIGHVLGPGDFYMRWHMEEDAPSIPVRMDSGWLTYCFGGVDHAEPERCSASRWTESDGENWWEACASKPSNGMANRTRVGRYCFLCMTKLTVK